MSDHSAPMWILLLHPARLDADEILLLLRLFSLRKSMLTHTQQWYYEVEVITTEYIRVGWAHPSFKPDPQRGKGVGDDIDSFSFAGK